MGTDVYLEWDGISKAEESERLTGFSIGAGRVGYLRASLGMPDENAVLHLLFSERIWNASAPARYDFAENMDAMRSSLSSYLIGKEIDVQKRVAEKTRTARMVEEVLSSQFGAENIFCPGMDDEDKKVWAKSLIDFFSLGEKLQREGRHPRVYISW